MQFLQRNGAWQGLLDHSYEIGVSHNFCFLLAFLGQAALILEEIINLAILKSLSILFSFLCYYCVFSAWSRAEREKSASVEKGSFSKSARLEVLSWKILLIALQCFLTLQLLAFLPCWKALCTTCKPHVPTSNISFGSASRLLYFSNSKKAKLTFTPSEKTCESLQMTFP